MKTFNLFAAVYNGMLTAYNLSGGAYGSALVSAVCAAVCFYCYKHIKRI